MTALTVEYWHVGAIAAMAALIIGRYVDSRRDR